MGICGAGNAGLVEMKSGGFVDNVNCMGRWPSYGGSAVSMEEWPAYGDLPKRMGRCVRRVAVWGNRENVWGNGLRGRPLNRMGEPRKHMGNATGYGNLCLHMGRPPGRMGSQKSHQNQKYRNGGRPASFVKIRGRWLVWEGRDTVWEDVLRVGNVRNAELYGEAAETYGGFHKHRIRCMACVMPGC